MRMFLDPLSATEVSKMGTGIPTYIGISACASTRPGGGAVGSNSNIRLVSPVRRCTAVHQNGMPFLGNGISGWSGELGGLGCFGILVWPEAKAAMKLTTHKTVTCPHNGRADLGGWPPSEAKRDAERVEAKKRSEFRIN